MHQNNSGDSVKCHFNGPAALCTNVIKICTINLIPINMALKQLFAKIDNF